MTPEIQAWMQRIRQQFRFAPGRVLEVGAQDINGTVRQYFPDALEYIGTDMQAGANVDIVLPNKRLLQHFGAKSFHTIIACEVLEHDVQFWSTLAQLKLMLKSGGHLIITTPTLGFPYHAYPCDYWRFTKDSYRDVFFKGMRILSLDTLDNAYAPQITLAGIASA